MIALANSLDDEHHRAARPARDHAREVVAAMSDPATYARRTGAVEVIETHGSWVFLTDDRVYKVKKPVVLPFLDYGTLTRRRELCREEVRLNHRLAPDLYVGTVALVRRGAGFALVPDDDARDTIEVAVEMVRFAERDTLAARVRTGAVTTAEVERVGHLLARFHAAADRAADADAAGAALRAAIRTTLDDVAAAPPDVAGPERIHALRRVLEAVLFSRSGELAGRAARGLVRDGHGDLRAEHVVLAEPPQVFDCLEFDPGLRITDVSADLAFLLMDLEALGAPRLAAALLRAYRAAGGDPGDDALLAALCCFRALVRAKVAIVRAGQPESDRPAARAEAAGLLALAERFAWRARGPMVLVCCGPAASGKSTLAALLAEQSGVAHVSSDLVRKDLAGVAPTGRAPEAAYAPAVTQATYRALGLRAAAELAGRNGVIVDATFHDAASRRVFADALGSAGADVLFVECRAPAAELERRAEQRARRPERVSDATADIVRRQLAAWAPLDEVTADRHTIVRTDRPAEDVLADVLAWLDRRVESNR